MRNWLHDSESSVPPQQALPTVRQPEDDPDLPAELQLLRASVAQFLRSEVTPKVADFESAGEFDWSLPARLRERRIYALIRERVERWLAAGGGGGG